MDPFDSFALQVSDQAVKLAAITPANADLAQATRALYVGTGGDLVVIGKDDSASVTLKNVPSGTILPLRVKRVAAATTATDILGLY
ncbi:spike base protein, RCAP_Rcc01079 family [Aquabacter sp. L1I39]|uniref:spike base protein, RCAP_Rcc01079 family n=1 Tax=Aquabacter sp. L1I39 TaxID=2820278 RepID=UPI001FFCEABF|nr:hypothetical protein [Aquabacter sp. L1I39]